jgi:hypothetical protein
MKKRIILFFLLAASVAGIAQQQSELPGNKELVMKARTLYVDSDTVFMRREQLVSSLLGRKEVKAWDLRVTNVRDMADLVIQVRRVPFSSHFTYAVTDRRTDTVVMAGKVDSWAGTTYGLIADEIVHKMKVYRGDPLAAQKGQQQPSVSKASSSTD